MSKNGKYVKIFRTIGITGIAYAVNYLITLFLTPYITNTIGTEAYGFVSLAKNVAQYATYATTALNSLAGRYISIEYHKKNTRQANIYFSSTFFGDVFLVAVFFAASLFFVTFLDHIFVIPEALVADVKFLFLFVFFRFLLVTLFNVFSVGAYISNKLDISGIFKGVSYVVEAVILIILFSLFHPSVAFVGIALLISSAVLVFSEVWITNKYVGELRISRKDFRIGSVITLVSGGIWTSITQLGNFLHNGLDLAICNLMLTPFAMGQLAIAQSIDLICKSIYAIVGHAFQPNLLKIYARDKMEDLLEEFRLAMNTSALFSNLSFAGFVSLGMAYYKLWIPNQDIDLIYKLTVICIATGISSGIVNPLYYIYSLTAKKMGSAFITIISGFLNVISMYFLIRYTDLGIYAVVWTTVVLISINNLIVHPLLMTYLLKIKWTAFYPPMFRNLLSCGVMTFVLIMFSRFYTPDSWLKLGLCIILYTMAGAVIHLVIVLTRSEKKRLFVKLCGRD